jgi:predicted Zn-dependent peptidase
VGGELNAYTTKEETIIHASFLKTDFRRALELLYDVLANSTFPEKELEKEKEVIKDEISSYKDAPGESIFDDFEDHIFRGDPLGRNILGTPESVDGLSRTDILEFQSRTYTADRIKLAVVGPFGSERVERTVAELFAGFQFADSNWENTFKGEGQPDRVVENLAQFQNHYMVGWRTCGIHGHDRRSLSLLNNILGGPAMNSRLGLNIREKHGIAYNIESYLNLYSDVGMMGIYLGCDPQQTEKAAALVAKEVAKLRETKLGTLQMSKAKKQFLGQMAMSEDNGLNSAVGAARALLHFGRVNDFETVASKIQAITAEQLQDVANAYLVPDRAFELIYKKQ